MTILERVFISTNLDAQYPNINLSSTAGLGSDHVPLIINFGVDTVRKTYPFHFEKWWPEIEGFREVVEKAWNTPSPHRNPMDPCQFKTRLLRKKVKGWAINVNADLKKKKSNAD